MTDLELAAGLAANQDEALQALVDRHYAAIYRLLLRLSNSDEAARELTQSCLLQIRDSARTFRGHSTFRTWALRIAFRSFAKSRPRWTTSLSDRIPTPSIESTSVDRVLLFEALGRLSPKLRDAFLIHELYGLSVREAATVLRIPEGTAKARIARARRFLSEQLQEPEEIHHVSTAIEIRNPS